MRIIIDNSNYGQWSLLHVLLNRVVIVSSAWSVTDPIIRRSCLSWSVHGQWTYLVVTLRDLSHCLGDAVLQTGQCVRRSVIIHLKDLSFQVTNAVLQGEDLSRGQVNLEGITATFLSQFSATTVVFISYSSLSISVI